MIPTYRGPAFIGAIVALSGFALIYWSLVGWGIVSGSTPAERSKSLLNKIKTPGSTTQLASLPQTIIQPNNSGII